MNTRLRSLLAGTGSVLAVLALGSFGCAIGADPGNDDDDDAAGGSGGANNECGMDCSSIQTDPCNRGVCDPVTGNCAVVPADNGTECDDGLFCTAIDTCNEGYCVGTGVTDCELDVSPCEEVVCNEAAKTCTTVPKTEGADCQPDDLCMINGTCTGGTCIGEPRNCMYAPVPSDCHVAECNPQNGQCEPRIGNEGGECTDPNDPCQVSGVCDAGTCTDTSLKNCDSFTNPATCTVGVCDSATGNCEGEAGSDGDSCNDLDPCTTGDECESGVCTPTGSITSCGPVDNCCPASCDETNDDDCVLNVLLMLEDVTATDWDKYRTALGAAGETFDEIDLDSASFPNASTLAGYNTIVWGDENTLDAITDTEAALLVDWLNLGNRNMFVTGLDVMWDLRGSTTGGEHDLYAMWGVTYSGDYSGSSVLTIDGQAGDPISADFVSPNGLVLSGTSDASGDYVDETVGPASHAGIYSGGSGSGLGHGALSRYDSGTYKVVWLGVNFHNGLTNATQQNLLMTNIINYFKN